MGRAGIAKVRAFVHFAAARLKAKLPAVDVGTGARIRFRAT
jgi:hypothetical protein